MRALALLVLLVPAAALAVPCVPTTYPGKDWPVRPLDPAKESQRKALETYAFTLTGADGDRLGIRTDSLLIIKGGEIIYEKYARGFDASKRHISWSVAKSVSSALIGVAVQNKALNLDDSVCKYIVGQRDEVCRIKVQNVLEFATGLDWQEEYEHSTYQVSSVIAMLFGEGHHDMLNFITAHRFSGTPGQVWRYSTGDATLLAAIAKSALVAKLGADWAWKGLFDVVGMKSVILEEDEKGTPLGGSHVFATPRDYARFGFLYLHDGCWNDTRVLPEEWVARSIEPSSVFATSAPATSDKPNGRMWWVNRISGPVTARPWKDAPVDTFSADGHWGQYVVVVPSEDVVIVRTGDDRNGGIDFSQMVSLALQVAK